ncbi:helix-turn-helix domain-containing protein [Thiohalorhabdus sp. Cl-TMA]|uniref:Helix-turn-helix domain-containing protein n=1 Tax=Thiohalorhabdus methylotrophus TaxID=3242694 RepID=A0ABV4TZ40_9GAMM
MGTEDPYQQPSEREHLCQCRIEGASFRTIGRELGRDPGTLSREVGRNRRRSGTYWPEAAGRKARAGAFGAIAARGMPSWALALGSAWSWTAVAAVNCRPHAV